jgi:hypothetical protein
MFNKRKNPAGNNAMDPRTLTDAKGTRIVAGIVIGSNRKMIPARVKKPSQSVAAQNRTTFVISKADNPQEE